MWGIMLAIASQLTQAPPSLGEPASGWHLAANGNFDDDGNFTPGQSGFNLADVSTPSQLDLLPNGVKALVWVGLCNGTDRSFTQLVASFNGNPKVFGYYLMDDPDPTGRYSPRCAAEHLRAESDWIHAITPNAKTFIALMNLASSRQPRFDGAYRPEETHIDLFGISPYPCRSELGGCDFKMISRYVAAAEAAGIPRAQMVPTYQTFGGGSWRNDTGGRYQLPSALQMQELLAQWDQLLVSPVFDYAYSWGAQRDDEALENAPDLKKLMAIRNARGRAAGN
jgi:hypothetical protein